MTENEHFPVKPGDWVTAKHTDDQFAKVKDVYAGNNEVLVDLVIYDCEGTKVGRMTPHEGGPRSFEPACSLDNWQRIKKPTFPIPIVWVPREDGRQVLAREPQKHLSDRIWEDKRKRSGYKAPKKSDLDPEAEAAARRLAAQELRDIARKHGVAEAVTRAEELEKEAEALSRPMR